MFILSFSTINDAFQDNPAEIARILRDIAELVDDGIEDGYIRDINGNLVGAWNLSD